MCIVQRGIDVIPSRLNCCSTLIADYTGDDVTTDDLLKAILGVAALGVSFYMGRRTSNNTRQQTYQRLEIASIELFRFEAKDGANAARLLYDGPPTAFDDLKPEDRIPLVSYVTQTLNLFEMAVSYRHDDVFPRDKFASWVIWFYEFCSSPTVQLNWADELKLHYSKELGNLIEKGIACLQEYATEPEPELRRLFFNVVANRFDDDPMIRGWLQDHSPPRRAKFRILR